MNDKKSISQILGFSDDEISEILKLEQQPYSTIMNMLPKELRLTISA